MAELEFNRETYREYPAVNYSKLSALSKHPKKVHDDKDFSDGLRNGDLLDLLCFEPDKVFEKYYVSTVNKLPSDAVKAIIEDVVKLEDFDSEAIVATARNHNYGGSWKTDTIYRKVMEDGEDYLNMLSEAKGKHIISFEEYTKLMDASKMLKSHSWTKQMFDGEFQVPLLKKLSVDEEVEILFKGLADSIVELEDHFILYDLKYSSSTLTYFYSDFVHWRYYLQAALYSDLLKKIKNKPVEVFYVIYSSIDNLPGIFHILDPTLDLGRNGGQTYSGKEVKGYKQLALDLQWHEENNLWDYPREVYENNGFELDVSAR